jgi:hypothetical protein
VGFVVNKVGREGFLPFPCQFSFHRLLQIHHLSSGAGTIGQLVADVPSGLTLTPPQETNSIGQDAGWALEPVWTTWRGEKCFSYRDSNTDPSAVQGVAICCTDCAVIVRPGAHQGNWQLKRNRDFREVLSAGVEHMLVNGGTHIEETETQLAGRLANPISRQRSMPVFTRLSCRVDSWKSAVL